MKIEISNGGKKTIIPIPTAMIFSRATVDIGLKLAKKYSGESMKIHAFHSGGSIHLEDIPPEAIHALCDEIRRIKKKHGSWLLVDVESAGGDRVRITL